MIDFIPHADDQTTERRATMVPRLNPHKAALEAMKPLAARARGKSAKRTYLLDAWPQSPLCGGGEDARSRHFESIRRTGSVNKRRTWTPPKPSANSLG
jgi:hypothetical protein